MGPAGTSVPEGCQGHWYQSRDKVLGTRFRVGLTEELIRRGGGPGLLLGLSSLLPLHPGPQLEQSENGLGFAGYDETLH